jgi:glycosyltransferase involved in cell wall biosynthesis
MNILFLAPQPFYQHRGTPIAVKMMLETLGCQGHNIHLLTYHEGEDVKISNVTIHRIPRFPHLKNIKPGPSWKKIACDLIMLAQCLSILFLHRKSIDVIHAVEEAVFMAIPAKAIFRTPFIYDMDSSLIQQLIDKYKFLVCIEGFLQSFERAAIRYSAGVIAVCRSLEEIVKRYDPGKTLLRLEDISLLEMEHEGGKSSETALDLQGPIIMYVGNLEAYQGIDLLLESFQQVVRSVPDVHLAIVGGNADDIQRYRDRSERLAITNNTHFIGQRPISQLRFYLDQADILVSPRLRGENTPMKIYSYLDSERPILATRLPTHTQVLDDQTAFLVLPEPQAMAEGLITLLQDNGLRAELAKRAKERARNDFSYGAFRHKISEFYRSLNDILKKSTK